jgi:anti-anti-sigma factor
MQWGNREVSPLAADVADVGPTAGATVLIAEDNADLRRFLTSLLGPHYPLLQARDGLEALELVRAHRPDLVLTDVMMPGLDGFELLAELRADPATSSIPVIVLSARAGQEAVAEGLAAGADDYLVKPFTSGDLLARVRSNLAMARLRGHEGAWRAALLNAMSDGLLIVEGETGAVVEINEAFTAMLGYGREGLPYRLPHPWWPDPDAEGDWHAEVTRALGAWREGAKGGRWLLPLRHRDGHPVWVEISTAPVPSRDGTGQMVVALVRDRTAEHRADERNRLLADSGRLLTQPGELSDRLAGFAGLVGEAFGALAVVLEAEPDGRMRVQAAAHPSRPDLADALRGVGGLRVPAPLRTDYQAGRATLLATVPEELLRETGLDADGVAALRRAGLRSALVAPLVVGGRLLGLLAMLAIGDPDPGGHPFDQADLELAEELGRRLAGVEEADRAADRERRLHDASAALAAASTVAQAAGALAEAFQRALGSAGVAVYAMRPDDPAHLHLEHNLGLGEEFSAGFAVIELAEGFTSSAVVRSGEPLWLGDRDSWAHRFSHLLSIPRVRDAEAVATLPLCLGERCLGALAATFVTEREFPAEERQFVLTLVGQAAQAFERATQTDAQWRIAQTLQRSLLPADVPAPPRLALATHYQPAGRFNQAGGDWYDIIELDDDRVGVVVGDVVGNGASAAAIMGQLRSALSGFLLAGNSPARALRLLSQFAERVDGALASTAVCLVLDTRTGELRWARAGHPPPLVLDPRADQPARYLSGADGPVLGLGAAFAEALPYTEAALTLRPGASVLLYTDGLIERRGEHLDSGLQRLTDATAPAACAAPRELLDAALHGSLDGACAADDVALVVARLLPAPLQGRLPAVPEQLGRLRRAVRAWASAAGVTAAATEDLQLALGEAVANAVEHAYPPGEPGEFTYHVEYEPDVSLRVDVLDNGRWRPEPADNSHRGRGVAMIRALAGGVSLDGTEHGTHVRFTLPAPGREVPAPAPEAAAPGPPPADETRPSDSGGAWLDTRRSADGGWVLRLGGELDLAATEPLRTELLRRVTESTETFVVDTAAVRYLASAGVRLLADLLRAAPDRVRLRVEPGTPAERALRATALHPAVLDSPALDIAGSASQ